MFYRLIKPNWAKSHINDEVNPHFVKEIKGPNVYEGYFHPEYIDEKNKEGYNIYYFPNHPSINIYESGKKFLSGRDIDKFNFVFVDMDLKDNVYKSKDEFFVKLSKFKLKPSLVVDSGNGVHAYWNVSDLTRESYIILQLALLTFFKTDESVWTVLQLMRVPGTYNTKISDNFKLATVIDSLSSNCAYNIVDFPRDIFNISKKLQNKADKHIAKLDGKIQVHLSEEINIDELPENFLDILYQDEKIYQLFTNPQEYYGDRSGADMALANILYNKDFNKKDAIMIIANTQKAISKDSYRLEYASNTVEKVYLDRPTNQFLTVSQRLKCGISTQSGDFVHGTYFFDCLHHKWMKKQVLGLIAGPGIGKTSVTLKMFKDMLENNGENDEVCIFFSLEMPEEDIIEKWISLVGEDSKLTDRLYVISNENDNGDPRNIGLQELYDYVVDIKKSTGKEILSVGIDHIGILSTHINIKHKYTFGVESEKDTGYGDIRTLSVNMVCTQLKTLAKMLNTFLIVLTQTTKDKGSGDIPIDKDGAYGISQYEKIVDYIITIWQPLMRVQHFLDHNFLAWQYVKIRKKHKLDAIQTHQQKLLTYEMDTGDLRAPNDHEIQIFKEFLPKAIEVRANVEKNKSDDYSRSLSESELNSLKSKLNDVNIK